MSKRESFSMYLDNGNAAESADFVMPSWAKSKIDNLGKDLYENGEVQWETSKYYGVKYKDVIAKDIRWFIWLMNNEYPKGALDKRNAKMISDYLDSQK